VKVNAAALCQGASEDPSATAPQRFLYEVADVGLLGFKPYGLIG
jgi:hypothetical protein